MNRLARLLACAALVACDAQPSRADYTAHFETASGLQTGAAVYVAGVRVGRVNGVSLDGSRAKVAFAVGGEQSFRLASADCVRIGFFGMGSEAHLVIEVGAGDGRDELRAGSEVSCVRENVTGASTQRAMESLEKLLNAATTGDGTISRLLNDRALADKVERFFDAPAAGAAAPAADPEPPPSAATPPVAPKPEPKPAAPKPKPAAPKGGSDILDPFVERK